MSAAKQKGTLAESAALAYLHSRGLTEAYRPAAAGAHDRGDLIIPGSSWAVESKNCATYAIPSWLRETEVERINAGRAHGLLIVKPRGIGVTKVDQWWGITYLRDIVEFL